MQIFGQRLRVAHEHTRAGERRWSRGKCTSKPRRGARATEACTSDSGTRTSGIKTVTETQQTETVRPVLTAAETHTVQRVACRQRQTGAGPATRAGWGAGGRAMHNGGRSGEGSGSCSSLTAPRATQLSTASVPLCSRSPRRGAPACAPGTRTPQFAAASSVTLHSGNGLNFHGDERVSEALSTCPTGTTQRSGWVASEAREAWWPAERWDGADRLGPPGNTEVRVRRAVPCPQDAGKHWVLWRGRRPSAGGPGLGRGTGAS